MLVTASTVLIRHAAYGLAAHDLAAEEAKRGVCQFFAGCGTAAANRFVGKGVVVLR